jgi:hypothetical protein
MNLNLERPEEFFIFCNCFIPMTVHNLKYVKRFDSGAFSNCSISKDFLTKYLEGTVNYLPFLPTAQDRILSPYCLTAINEYRIEYDAEISRSKYYSKYPSRFSAVFAFGDWATCKEVHRKYGWDLSTVKKFKIIDSPLTRVIKVNMEIVSLARTAYRISYSDMNELDHLWKHYWNGGGDIQMELPDPNCSRTIYSSGEIFEYLIEGTVVLIE